MRFLTILTVILAAILCASSAFANRTADSLAAQARLTDASNNPVADGPKDVIISLWTDSVGGTMLHSQTNVVTTNKGLFTTCVGCGVASFFDIFTDISMFMQVQLAGQAPMTPRIRVSSAPFAITASGLNSEVTNGTARGRGIISVKSPTGVGSMTNGKILLDADSDGDGHADFTVIDSVSNDGAVRSISGDSDDDGLSDEEISSAITPTTAHFAINTKGTGAQSGRSVSIQSGTTLDSAIHDILIDDDGDGNPEVSMRSKGIVGKKPLGGMTTRMTFDDDDNGIPEASLESKVGLGVVGATVPGASILSSALNSSGAVIASNNTGINEKLPYTRLFIDEDGDGKPEAQTSKVIGGTFTGGPSDLTLQFVDSDDDGSPDNEISSSVTPTTSSVAIKTKGTGADANRTASITTTTTVGGSSTTHVVDENGDGNPECKESVSLGLGYSAVKGTFSAPSRVHPNTTKETIASELEGVCRVTADSDDDGLSDADASLVVTPTTSSLAIKTKGTGAQRNQIQGTAYQDSAVQYATADLDGDGIAEAKAVSSVSSLAGGGGGASAAAYAATGRLSVDSDDDGVPEATVETSAGEKRSEAEFNLKAIHSSKLRLALDTGAGDMSVAMDSDNDGQFDQEVSSKIVPTRSYHAVNTKGTGAQIGRVVSVSSATTVDSAVFDNSIDNDGDGTPETSYKLKNLATSGDAGVVITIRKRGINNASTCSTSVKTDSVFDVGYVDSDGDGVPESEAISKLTPTTASLAIKTKGTSAQRVAMLSEPDSASITIDEGGVHVAMTTEKTTGTTRGAVYVYAGGHPKVVLNSDGNGYLDNMLGIGVAATHRIDVAGGAYCDGTNWTNASDVNSKENFAPIDGAEILEQISELEITRWNYKADTETDHIGPTAQDFQQVFGVGSDGKSISTIDPSGIALAAIKELNKKVKEVDQLKSELQELKALVQKLAAEKSAEKVSR